MIYPIIFKYKWYLISISIFVVLYLINKIRNFIYQDIATRFSTAEEKAKVKVDIFRNHVQVKPAQIYFDNPEKYYPYLSNKFGKYVGSHQFKNLRTEIKFIFEKFPDKIYLKKLDTNKLKFGIDCLKRPAELILDDNFSNLRIIGNQGIGKTNISKICIQQIQKNYKVYVLSTKISDFDDFKNSNVDLLTPNKTENLQLFLKITDELKEKIKNEQPCKTWLILDEAIKDLTIDLYEKGSEREEYKKKIVENINYFLSLGRKFKLFLLLNTQDENIKNSANLDLAKIGNFICGRFSNETSANFYGIPAELSSRRDLTNGKLILATQQNRECIVFKSYLFKRQV
jgi:hypothetical protein